MNNTDKIIEILKKHCNQIDFTQPLWGNQKITAAQAIMCMEEIDSLYSTDISEEEIDELCPWDKELFPINYEKWCEGFKAAISKLKPREVSVEEIEEAINYEFEETRFYGVNLLEVLHQKEMAGTKAAKAIHQFIYGTKTNAEGTEK